jgi:hypothetical protein
LKTYSNTPKSLLNCVTSILNKFSSSTPIIIGAEGGAKKPSFLMAFFLFSEVRVSVSIPLVIGTEGGAKKPSEMMAFLFQTVNIYSFKLIN